VLRIPRMDNGICTSRYLDIDIVLVWFVIRGSRGRRSLYDPGSLSSGILEADRFVVLAFHGLLCKECEKFPRSKFKTLRTDGLSLWVSKTDQRQQDI
jgi:hypothetical protein